MTRYVLRSVGPAARTPDFQNDLNAEQRVAALAGDGALLIIAGAGTGKTRTLTYRAAHLLASGLAPQQLLLCTFTNRAAREMVRRVEAVTGIELRSLWAGTFHHIANLALRRYASELALNESYTILDREDARDLMASCLADGSTPRVRRLPRGQVLQHIASTAVNRQLSISEALACEAPQFIDATDEISALIERYTERKRKLGLLDYDDLLVQLWRLLTDCPLPRAELTARFRHVLVDEYQDTNRLQGDIVDALASEHGNLTVVGDDAQSIYSFRGAHLGNMLQFQRRHPAAQISTLETSYRSTPEILRLANASIRHNARQYPKSLRAVRPAGSLPVLVPLADVYQQAAFIGQRVLELQGEEDIPLNEIAVLYRAHAHSMELQLELARRQIPYAVRSGLRFFEQAHIKDVVAYLRLVHNSRDPLAWQRVLRSCAGVGRRSAEHVLDTLLQSTSDPSGQPASTASALLGTPALVQRLPPKARTAVGQLARLLDTLAARPGVGEAIRHLVEKHYRAYVEASFSNASTRFDDLLQLAEYAERYSSLETFLSELSLVADVAAEAIGHGDRPDEVLTLSTIHQAKGLEWRVVFVLALAEGRFPSAMAVRTPQNVEEERRLFYVAATRAKDQLYLCHPRFEQPASGPQRLLRLSRFVEELSVGNAAPFERWEIETC